MKYLLKSVTILDKNSTYHQQKKDILIEEGQLIKIADQIDEEAEIISGENLVVSKGWVDIKSRLCDPGYEHIETIESGLDAAAYGGFTHVCTVPSTLPVTDQKTQVEYQINRANNHVVQIHPYGALTKGMEGNEMAEYYDMQNSGAIAFHDDELPVKSGILYRALLYAKSFNGTMAVSCLEESISRHGVVNEGKISAKTGLKASPAVAEWIEVKRNIELAKYTGGKIHLTGITTKESVDIIAQAKQEGVQITADIQIEHLIFNEDKNLSFDTNYRFEPVLRTEEDRKALWAGLQSGAIDYIAVNHRPCDHEEKDIVFENAACGVIRFQTAINELMQAPEFDIELVTEVLSNRNRAFLHENDFTIEENTEADLTLIDLSAQWTFDESELLSKSRNTYMLDQEMKGKVLGVFNRGKAYLK